MARLPHVIILPRLPKKQRAVQRSTIPSERGLRVEVSGLRICISHAVEDRRSARSIGALCAELGIDHRFDDRNDWLMRGIRQGDDDFSHLLVIVSRATIGSWWVPFLVGRVEERGGEILLFLAGDGLALSAFLRGRPVYSSIDDLRAGLDSREAQA